MCVVCCIYVLCDGCVLFNVCAVCECAVYVLCTCAI